MNPNRESVSAAAPAWKFIILAATGVAPEAVFGADDFFSVEIGSASNRFSSPVGVCVDADGRL